MTSAGRFISILFLLTFSPAALAQTNIDKEAVTVASRRLDNVRTLIDRVEQTLVRVDASDATLSDLRSSIEPASHDLQDIVESLSPRLETYQSRLDQLGPKPAEKTPPEDTAVMAERDEIQQQYNLVDATLKRARLLAVQADQASISITTRRRLLFTRALFARADSLLNPSLWLRVFNDIPREARAVSIITSDLASAASSRLESWTGVLFIALVTLIGLLNFAGQKFAVRVIWRKEIEDEAPNELQRLLAALWRIAITAIIPILTAAAAAVLIKNFNLFNSRLDPLIEAVFEAVVRVSLAMGIISGLLAPGQKRWRLLDLSDAVTDRLKYLVLLVSALVSAWKIAESILEIIGASLSVTVALRGTGALIVALAMAASLKGILINQEEDDCLGPRVIARRDWYGPLRALSWLAIIVIFISVFIGYIAFASFVTDQVVWLAFLGAALYFLLELSDKAIPHSLTQQSPIGHIAVTTFGLRRESLAQLSVVLAGVTSVVCISVITLLVLAPWGVESDDVLGSFRAAFFGFKVGDITISLSNIASALFIFIVGSLITRALQKWLDQRFLPNTQLDLGLRNSIRTSLGYIGFFCAATFALVQIGLNFEKLAIVAGALSVGIGFGLQSIVNNFVSGLILLWERAVRVGDWVVVGDEQGYVKRINVRSTEIETFDRATMIVPNSNLITGIVKNWVSADRVGRIKVLVSVNISADPDKVRELLLACALKHESVLKIPAPQVVFTSMAESGLKFELVCFVSDVETSGRTKSDLHFAIFKDFRAAGLEIFTGGPPPPTRVSIEGLHDLIDRAAPTRKLS